MKKNSPIPYKIAVIPFLQEAIQHNAPEAAWVYRKYMKRNPVCFLFSSMEDFAAFKDIKDLPLMVKPSACDCVIMEDASNLFCVAVELDDYDRVFMFLENSHIWQTVAQTIEDRNQRHVYNCSCMFKGYQSLREYVKTYARMVKKTLNGE